MVIRYTVKDATTTTVTSEPNPSQGGQTVVYLAVVSNAGGSRPTGTVTFEDNGTPIDTVSVLPGGEAILMQTYTSAGTHSITATYSGNDTSESSTSDVLVQTVT